jgi:hypothetical protein
VGTSHCFTQLVAAWRTPPFPCNAHLTPLCRFRYITTRGQAALRSDRPSRPRGPPRLCQPGRPLELPVGSPEAGGGGLVSVYKNESPPLEQPLYGLECLRVPPGTGFSILHYIWF